MKKSILTNLQKQCDNFNAISQSGGRIMFKQDGVDTPYEARTRSEAYVLSEHTPVVFIEGISGCYCLTHCEPITETTTPENATAILLARLKL